MQVYAKKYMTLKLKCRKNKSYNEKKTTYWSIVTSVLLNHLSSASLMSLHSGCWNRFFFRSFCSNALKILFLFFQIIGIILFMGPNFQHTSAYFFHFLLVISL